MERNLTEGSILNNIVIFSLSYLLSYFLQQQTIFCLQQRIFVGNYKLSLFIQHAFQFQYSCQFCDLAMSAPSELFCQFLFYFTRKRHPIFLSAHLSRYRDVQFSIRIPGFFSDSDACTIHWQALPSGVFRLCIQLI